MCQALYVTLTQLTSSGPPNNTRKKVYWFLCYVRGSWVLEQVESCPKYGVQLKLEPRYRPCSGTLCFATFPAFFWIRPSYRCGSPKLIIRHARNEGLDVHCRQLVSLVSSCISTLPWSSFFAIWYKVMISSVKRAMSKWPRTNILFFWFGTTFITVWINRIISINNVFQENIFNSTQ